jgi:cell division protein FtsB
MKNLRPNRCEYIRFEGKLYNDEGFRLMKIKNQITEKISLFLQRLGDIRFVGQLLFVAIVLLISWSGIKTIQTNYGLQKQISVLNQQNTVQRLQNNNLALQNDYLNSNQYLELSARQNFGLAAPGEQELIVPASVALSYTTNVPSPSTPIPASAHQPAYQRHFEAWVDFFLHRPNTSN